MQEAEEVEDLQGLAPVANWVPNQKLKLTFALSFLYFLKPIENFTLMVEELMQNVRDKEKINRCSTTSQSQEWGFSPGKLHKQH